MYLLLLAVVSYVSVIFADAYWHSLEPRTKGGKLIIRLDDWQASYRANRARTKA